MLWVHIRIKMTLMSTHILREKDRKLSQIFIWHSFLCRAQEVIWSGSTLFAKIGHNKAQQDKALELFLI